MQGYGRFTTACDPLNDECCVFGCTDNAILLRLNRGDDIAELVIFIFAQSVEQELISDREGVFISIIGIDNTLENLLAHNQVSLQID
ncbi:hypothetical protein D3C85_1367600 [compost metagenome]